MSDWLYSIELFNKRQRDNFTIPMPWETPDERMTRVLRELAGYAVFLEAYCSESMSVDKARKRFAMSDDAKEILK